MIRYIRLSDFGKMLRPQGPLFAFIVPWLVVMIGQLSAICGIIKPIYTIFYLIVIGNIITIILLAFYFQVMLPRNLLISKSTICESLISRRFKKITYSLMGLYVIGQLAQWVHFRGFPLYWLIVGAKENYSEYGIQSINGLLNAVYLLSITSMSLIYFKEQQRKQLLVIALAFIFPVLMVTRQVLICASLQILCCSLLYHPAKVKRYFFYGACVLVVFIVLGNYRTGMGQLAKILEPKPFIPAVFYPLLWVYAYVVTPFNNINAAINSIHPLGVPVHELLPIIPNVLRSYVDFGTNVDTGYTLVHQNMNVSTFYLGPLLDFGPIYAFFLMVLFQVLLLVSYRKAARTKSPIHIIEYSIFYMISMLSIFNNLLFFLPVIFQLVILNLAKIKLLRRRGQSVLCVGKI